MRLVPASFSFEHEIDGQGVLDRLEGAARTCYKSERKIAPKSAEHLLRKIIKRGHYSVLEHVTVSIRIVCDRGISHELVRHRVASFSQESTRYCSYDKDQFGSEVTFIDLKDHLKSEKLYTIWLSAMAKAERAYFNMLAEGAPPEMARSVLPNSLKTELVMTCNLREWRHFFALRAQPAAHPQMRELAKQMLKAFKEKVPVIFESLP